MPKIVIDMPYEPDVSVNHCYNRGNPRFGVKKHVNNWLVAFQVKLNNALQKSRPKTAAIEVRLEIICPQQKGRMPDTTNFMKLLMDSIAVAVGYDDWTFAGHCVPAKRVKDGEEPLIKTTIIW